MGGGSDGELLALTERSEVFSADVYKIEGVSRAEKSRVLLAQALVSGGEYQRAAHLLAEHKKLLEARHERHGLPGEHQPSSLFLFLMCYAKYMAGEKLRDQLAAEKSTAGGDDGKSGTGARSKPTKGADNKVSSYLLLLLLCRIGDCFTTTHRFCKLRCFSVISTSTISILRSLAAWLCRRRSPRE